MFKFLEKNVDLLLLISLTVLLINCSEAPPPLKPISQKDVILAFGDSLTFGTGAKSDQSYPSHLERLINRKVINAGIPGELSEQGLKRLPAVLDEHSPKLLILCHGGNDLLRKFNQQKIVNNISEMIKIAQQRGIQVLLLGVPEPALFLLESAPFYREIAAKHNIPIQPDIIPHVESNQSLKSDRIHPNAKGYQKMAQSIMELLTRTGAI